MTNPWRCELAVLDIGEVVEDGTDVIVATFIPTPESIAAWEERVTVLNAEARAWQQLRSAAIAKFSADCCRGGIAQAAASDRPDLPSIDEIIEVAMERFWAEPSGNEAGVRAVLAFAAHVYSGGQFR